MSQQSYDRKQLQDLKAAAKELHELSRVVQHAIDQAAESGVLRPAKDAFAKLQLKTAEYEKFRATLSPEVLFLAKYNVEVHGSHEVSFVLPKGVSRIEMLQEAQALVLEDSHLIYPDHLTIWQIDPKFRAVADTTQRIHIDGHVQGGDGKSRGEQEAFLKAEGLQMPSLEDLAVAFGAHYVATRAPLFGFYKSEDYTSWVRAAGGALNFFGNGLYARDIDDGSRYDHVAVAAALPGIKKT